jgi:hypothetical protein
MKSNLSLRTALLAIALLSSAAAFAVITYPSATQDAGGAGTLPYEMCSFTVVYSAKAPDSDVAIAAERRNPISRCSDYTDRVAMGAAVLKLLIDPSTNTTSDNALGR